jgi:hypothetical protein
LRVTLNGVGLNGVGLNGVGLNGVGIVVPVGVVRANIVQFNSAAVIKVADGLVTDNVVVANDIGIVVEEAAVVTGNRISSNRIGVDVTGTGSSQTGNVSDGNSEIGLRVHCPANLTHNAAIGNATNLVLNGADRVTSGNWYPDLAKTGHGRRSAGPPGGLQLLC